MKKMLSMAAAFLMFTSQTSATPMSLNVHDSDLRTTIMMIARAGRLNVSLDDSVEGKISVTISNVEPEKILDTIAKTKNLNLVKDGKTYIITTNFNSSSLMKSYVLPIKYGDAEFLKKAVVMSLDAAQESLPEQMTRKKNSDGTYTYSYSYRNGERTTSAETVKREDRVLINSDVNSLILFGTQAEYERAKQLLDTLDVELKQVSVEARIVAIDKNASKNLGVEWFWSAAPQYPERDIEYHAATYNSNGSVRNQEYYEEEYTRKANDSTGYGIFQFGRGPEGIPFEWYYGAKINALVTDGKAKVLSRPNVTTIQGREAVINVGSSVPIPRVDVSNSITTTSIEYKDAGIILKYTPRVNDDGTITATIHTEVSTPQYVEDMRAYRFNTRSADTTVTVRDGEPMVIGGLIGSEESKNISKIPILGDLPILGALFKNHRKSNSESELIIFLTAHVLNN